MTGPIAKRFGHCPVCEKDTTFNIWGASFRDSYLCNICGSNPRQRSLGFVLNAFYPNWRNLIVHESSPGDAPLSHKLFRECSSYIATQYDPSFAFGQQHADGWRNENLEQQTFGDEGFDLVITQDVFEHIFHPDRAIREIARTLKPGGAHIATAPLVHRASPSLRRAKIDDAGSVVHLEEPEYHQNPVSEKGSLVTIWWGYDIASYFNKHAPTMNTMIFPITNTDFGIEGPLTEVIFSQKTPAPDL